MGGNIRSARDGNCVLELPLFRAVVREEQWKFKVWRRFMYRELPNVLCREKLMMLLARSWIRDHIVYMCVRSSLRSVFSFVIFIWDKSSARSVLQQMGPFFFLPPEE